MRYGSWDIEGTTMDFALSEELVQIRDTVRRFMASEVKAPTAEAERTGRFPREIIARMGEAGFFGTAFPEEVGGSGSASRRWRSSPRRSRGRSPATATA
jgi:alkylation response protein AidB-like acyl-CoA dehydrogenase